MYQASVLLTLVPPGKHVLIQELAQQNSSHKSATRFQNEISRIFGLCLAPELADSAPRISSSPGILVQLD
jgi:hypothetical protein